MKWLIILGAAALIVCMAAEGTSREPVVVLQFDDARASHYDYAFPILEQYGLKGSFGIITGILDIDPLRLTRVQVMEMAAAGHEIHDHTLHHNPGFWGDVANAPAWRDTIQKSLGIFGSMGLTTRGWNQPGGTGQGWSQALRDTLALFYDYAAGRVGLEFPQVTNFHWHLLDDPFSLGRGGVYSWGYNRGASQAQELENMITVIADGIALGLFMVPAFHNVWEGPSYDRAAAPGALVRHTPFSLSPFVSPPNAASAVLPDDSTAWAVAKICSFLVANDITVLRMEDAVYRAQHAHEFVDKWEEQIPNPGFENDLNADGRPDGWEMARYAFDAAHNGAAGVKVVEFMNNAGTFVYGPETGPTTLRFMARLLTAAPIEVLVFKQKLDHSFTLDVFKPKTTDRWGTFRYAFDVPEGTERLQIRFVNVNLSNRLWVANMSLKLTGTAVGIDGRNKAPDLALWPNPAADEVNVLVSHSAQRVRVYDVRGRLVGEFTPAAGLVHWSVRDWPTGVYFATIMDEGRILDTGRFTVLR